MYQILKRKYNSKLVKNSRVGAVRRLLNFTHAGKLISMEDYSTNTRIIQRVAQMCTKFQVSSHQTSHPGGKR